jgi:hypothetical protein
MSTNRLVNVSIKEAIAEQMALKGRLFELDPHRQPDLYDPDLMKHAANQAGDNVAWSLFGQQHDNFKPILEDTRASLINHFESQGEKEEFLDFVKNYSFTSEDVMDALLDMAEADEEEGSDG